jgi:hypothetical protein
LSLCSSRIKTGIEVGGINPAKEKQKGKKELRMSSMA